MIPLPGFFLCQSVIPAVWEAVGGGPNRFKTHLAYRVSAKPAWPTEGIQGRYGLLRCCLKIKSEKNSGNVAQWRCVSLACVRS